MKPDLIDAMGSALGSVSKHYASLLTDPMTEIEIYPAPYLSNFQISRIQHLSPNKPALFYVGFALGEKAYLLTGAPENFIELALADVVFIDSKELAISYATTYLEVTRTMSELFYLVRSIKEALTLASSSSKFRRKSTSSIDRTR